MEKFKKGFKLFIGVLLMPIMFSVFVADRLVVVPFVWLKTESLMQWLRKNDMIVESVIRVTFALVVLLIFKWIF
jgi:hypothetical protein